jgi:hypothetical protein
MPVMNWRFKGQEVGGSVTMGREYPPGESEADIPIEIFTDALSDRERESLREEIELVIVEGAPGYEKEKLKALYIALGGTP